MDFDLRLLRHARALAEEGSFARGARSLHLTQPALSRSIQELERRTGIKLFDRNKGLVEPTDLGRMFLAHARALLGQAEALEREVAAMRGSGTGQLVVGSGTFPTVLFMGKALAAFLRKNPQVGVRVANDNWLALITGLRRREFDFIVAAPPTADESSGLVTRPLSFAQGYFLVRPGHPLAGKRDPSLRDILAHPLITTDRVVTPIAALLRAARSGGGERALPDVACESHEMMRSIAQATDHVMLSSLAANARMVERGELVPLPFVDPRIGVTFAVIGLEARTLPPIADTLIHEVIAADRLAVALADELAARFLPPSFPRTVAGKPAPRRRDTGIAASR